MLPLAILLIIMVTILVVLMATLAVKRFSKPKPTRTSADSKWAKMVKRRDKFTCQTCKTKNKRMVAHHLFSYKANPKLRLKLDNGICICEICHKRFHGQFGYGKNTPQQFTKFTKSF